MRNIYDIIAEQKAIVDVDLASYDLTYTIESFNNNDFYIEEGLGEAVKNIGRKLVEFVKKILAKIRELIRNVISFFKKSNDAVERMEDKIAEAAAGGGGGGGSDDKEDKKEEKEPEKKEDKKEEKEPEKKEDKKEEKKEEKEPEKKVAQIGVATRHGLQAPTVDKEKMERLKRREEERNERQAKRDRRTNTDTIYADNRRETIGKIGSKARTGLTDAYKNMQMKLQFKDFPYLNDAFEHYDTILFLCEEYMEDFIDEKINTPFSEFAKGKEMTRWKAKMDEDLGEKGMREEYSHKIVQLVSDYIYDGDRCINRLNKMERKTEERIKKMLNNAVHKPDLSEAAASTFQQVVNLIANYANKYSRMIATGRQHFIQLSWKVTNAYCDKLNAERGR